MMSLCKSLGTFLSANFPFTIELERMGSVGVMQAPIAKEWRKLRLGTSPHISKLLLSHERIIPGPSSKARLLHSFNRYRLGNCTPASTNWIPRTSRVKSNVMAARFFSDPSAYSRGWMTFVAWEEKVMPASRETTVEVRVCHPSVCGNQLAKDLASIPQTRHVRASERQNLSLRR